MPANFHMCGDSQKLVCGISTWLSLSGSGCKIHSIKSVSSKSVTLCLNSVYSTHYGTHELNTIFLPLLPLSQGLCSTPLVSTHVVYERLCIMQRQARLRKILIQNSLSVPTQVFEECGVQSTPPP